MRPADANPGHEVQPERAPGVSSPALPADDPHRAELHDEVHARPPAQIRLPALVVSVALLNEGVDRATECAHLQRLPGHQGLQPSALAGNFLRLNLALGAGQASLKYERHTEFTRYVLVQPLPDGVALGDHEPALLQQLQLPEGWLAGLPGRTMAALVLSLLPADLAQTAACMAQGRRWFGDQPLVASMVGNPGPAPADTAVGDAAGLPVPAGHSLVLTDFRLRPDGFEHLLLLAPADTSPSRAGRTAQRLLELEIYRLMALRGLPVAKALGPVLADSEAALAGVTARLEARQASEAELLDQLIQVAARVERATAEHGYRFSATRAYDALVRQRLAELREKPVPGTQTLGEFMQRRLSPAIATVASTEQRLAALSQRIERSSALLRTRVDISTEAQNQQLLARLTEGQQLQLNLQATVEGLSIAAISYYVISLVLYAAKGLKAAGLPLQPEMAAGALVPLVLWGVWRTTRRIHARLMHPARH
jgi:uncharacterized membrane-anchored protein